MSRHFSATSSHGRQLRLQEPERFKAFAFKVVWIGMQERLDHLDNDRRLLLASETFRRSRLMRRPPFSGSRRPDNSAKSTKSRVAVPIVREKRLDAEQLVKRRDNQRSFGSLDLLRLERRGTPKLPVADLNAIERAKN